MSRLHVAKASNGKGIFLKKVLAAPYRSRQRDGAEARLLDTRWFRIFTTAIAKGAIGLSQRGYTERGSCWRRFAPGHIERMTPHTGRTCHNTCENVLGLSQDRHIAHGAGLPGSLLVSRNDWTVRRFPRPNQDRYPGCSAPGRKPLNRTHLRVNVSLAQGRKG